MMNWQDLMNSQAFDSISKDCERLTNLVESFPKGHTKDIYSKLLEERLEFLKKYRSNQS